MTFVWGAVLAAGLLLVVSPWLWPAAARPKPTAARTGRLSRGCSESAGLARVPPAATGGGVACCAPSSLAAVAWLLTQVAALAVVAAVAGGVAPFAWLRARRSRLLRSRRALWPDVCDLLIASVRAGMSLPDAVASLADSAPAALRPPFAAFARDVAASGHFDSSAQRLKVALADPVADRIVETLRMARQVGGTELTPVLRALAASVRADAALRAEVESRQSWIRGAAVLGVAAPWVILALLAMRPEGARAYGSPEGVVLILAGRGGLVRRLSHHAPHRPASRAAAVVRMSAARRRPTSRSRSCSAARSASACACSSRSPRGGVRRRWRAGSRRTSAMSPIRAGSRCGSTRRAPASPRCGLRRRRRLASLAGGSASLERRLHQAGWAMDAAAFRGRQLGWAVGGVAVGGAWSSCSCCSDARQAALVLCRRSLASIAAFAYDARLTHAARARVGAHRGGAADRAGVPGAVPLGGRGHPRLPAPRERRRRGRADRRAARRGARRRHRLVAVGGARRACRARLEIPPLSRSIDQLVAAIDRGAPLAHVLHAQALDAREDAKRGLIERAGRKEIYMLIPLVFLILPLSVLFAVFPGIFMLRLGIG